MGRENAIACYRELGNELRRRRKAAGLSAGALAHRTGWHISKISRIESGQADINEFDVLHYLGFCGVYEPNARDMIALCRHARRRIGYWLNPHREQLSDSLGSLIYHETAADTSTIYQPQLVHGLLQTADYARARIAIGRQRTSEDIEQRVRLRLKRQRILRVPHPAPFTFFLNEAALRLEVGSAAIMHEQLLKIVLVAALEHITVCVVPSSAGERSVVGGSFSLFRYSQCAPLVYIDLVESGLFLEDRSHVEPYRKLLPDIAEVALSPEESREFIAELANEYDRRCEQHVGHHLQDGQA